MPAVPRKFVVRRALKLGMKPSQLFLVAVVALLAAAGERVRRRPRRQPLAARRTDPHLAAPPAPACSAPPRRGRRRPAPRDGARQRPRRRPPDRRRRATGTSRLRRAPAAAVAGSARLRRQRARRGLRRRRPRGHRPGLPPQRRLGHARADRRDVAELPRPPPGARASARQASRSPTQADEDRLHGDWASTSPSTAATTTSTSSCHGERRRGQAPRARASPTSVVVDDLVKRTSTASAPTARTRARRRGRRCPAAATTTGACADFEADMKALAERNPTLVKPITLPEQDARGPRRSRASRSPRTSNVADGKPVFLQHRRPPRARVAVGRACRWSGPTSSSTATARTSGRPACSSGAHDRRARSSTPTASTSRARRRSTCVNGPPTSRCPAEAAVPSHAAGHRAVLVPHRPVRSYKRRNCRLGRTGRGRAPAGLRAVGGSRDLGVDPNRNYGGLWGGPGASAQPDVRHLPRRRPVLRARDAERQGARLAAAR